MVETLLWKPVVILDMLIVSASPLLTSAVSVAWNFFYGIITDSVGELHATAHAFSMRKPQFMHDLEVGTICFNVNSINVTLFTAVN